MKVFVAGATGVIGRRLMPQLVELGHEVTAMTRSTEKAARLGAIGVKAVVCDVYDRGTLIEVLRGWQGDLLVHLLTDLPTRFDPRAGTASTDRLRREGTRNLLAAAEAGGVRRVIAESIAFLYRPDSPSPTTEQSAPWVDAPDPFGETVRAVLELERQVIQARSVDGIVLRFGWLYGPGTWYAPDGSVGVDVHEGRYPIVGGGRGYWSFVHVDDAAGAILAAIARGEPGIYNVVDDDPAPMRAWLPAFAEAIGARPLSPMSGAPTGAVPGREADDTRRGIVGASNAKARHQLGWTPRYSSWRTGFRAFDPAPAPRRRR